MSTIYVKKYNGKYLAFWKEIGKTEEASSKERAIYRLLTKHGESINVNVIENQTKEPTAPAKVA